MLLRDIKGAFILSIDSVRPDNYVLNVANGCSCVYLAPEAVTRCSAIVKFTETKWSRVRSRIGPVRLDPLSQPS